MAATKALLQLRITHRCLVRVISLKQIEKVTGRLETNLKPGIDESAASQKTFTPEMLLCCLLDLGNRHLDCWLNLLYQ